MLSARQGSRMTIVAGLRRLLKPRHIAVAGGRLAAVIIRECDRIGYAGPIWPIHPEKDEIAGHKAYRSVDDLPEAPDAAFVATPSEPTVGCVRADYRRSADVVRVACALRPRRRSGRASTTSIPIASASPAASSTRASADRPEPSRGSSCAEYVNGTRRV